MIEPWLMLAPRIVSDRLKGAYRARYFAAQVKRRKSREILEFVKLASAIDVQTEICGRYIKQFSQCLGMLWALEPPTDLSMIQLANLGPYRSRIWRPGKLRVPCQKLSGEAVVRIAPLGSGKQSVHIDLPLQMLAV